MALPRTIAVYYEHPDWFRPLFTELERRGIAHERVDASRFAFDPAEHIAPSPRGRRAPIASASPLPTPASATNGATNGGTPRLVFNRMSPSAWKRGRAHAILYTLHYLRYLERAGTPVFNGTRAFTVETSKALQISLIRGLGLLAPRTRVVNHASVLPEAARTLVFPLIVKPNIGGSGAGIVRFDSLAELDATVAEDRIPSSLDGILLLQEFHAPIGGSIVRVETLEARYLYGIRVHIGAGAGFDLCPADICKDVSGHTLESAACPVGAAKAGLQVEGYDPPERIRLEVERIAARSQLDVGGVEYLESRRDGRRYYYDINALSNFIADPVRVVGFDPTARLVDALVARAEAAPGASRLHARRARNGADAIANANAPIVAAAAREGAAHPTAAAAAGGRP